MLDYFIKVLLFQTLFLFVYDFLLKRETFFQWNRAYLISTSLLSYILPVIKIDRVTNSIPQEYIIWLPEVVLSPQKIIQEQIDWSSLFFTSLKWIFWIGVVLTSILFLVRLIKLVRLILDNKKEKRATFSLIFINSSSAFSFFNYIFLGSHIPSERKPQIITHELVHVRQKHTLDLLFFEVQKIIFWFNPYSYTYQSRITELHEFIADAKCIKTTKTSDYFQELLAETFSSHKISFINPFFKHSLIKKRIVMLNKAKSKHVLKLKYLIILPLLIGMLIYSSCEREENDILKKDSNVETIYESTDNFLSGKTIEEIIKELEDIKQQLTNSKLDERERRLKEIEYTLLLYKKEKLLANSNEIIEIQEQRSSEDVPFARVEEVPVFPGCEDSANPKGCFNKKMMQHVKDNFDVNLANSLNLSTGKKRIFALFKITKEGTLEVSGVRAPHKDLEKETRRVLSEIPKIQPGRHNGENVGVPYQLPIVFEIK